MLRQVASAVRRTAGVTAFAPLAAAPLAVRGFAKGACLGAPGLCLLSVPHTRGATPAAAVHVNATGWSRGCVTRCVCASARCLAR
jgi:hypothetical protein